MTSPDLSPIERSISVSWTPAQAFTRFTEEFGRWWPSRTHSIGGARVARVVFETRVGGRIYEQHADGRRFQWGQVVEYQPPTLVRFTWHPSREPATAQDVVVRFVAEGAGTRVELVSSGWDKWGANAARARRGYDLGWKYILEVWGERRSVRRALVTALTRLLGAVERIRHGGRDGVIAAARGEIAKE